MIRCANARCKWQSDAAPTGCTLFCGKSWLDCRAKTVRTDTPSKTPHRKESLK